MHLLHLILQNLFQFVEAKPNFYKFQCGLLFFADSSADFSVVILLYRILFLGKLSEYVNIHTRMGKFENLIKLIML